MVLRSEEWSSSKAGSSTNGPRNVLESEIVRFGAIEADLFGSEHTSYAFVIPKSCQVERASVQAVTRCLVWWCPVGTADCLGWNIRENRRREEEVMESYFMNIRPGCSKK